VKTRPFPTCFFLILFALLPLLPIVRVSADNVGWDLQVTNLAGDTINFTYGQLLAMPQTYVSASLYCYGLLVTDGNWGGVRLGYLLQQAGADPEQVSFINFVASDGYQVTIPIEVAMRQDVIVAYEMDGTPLSEGLRLVVPGVNGSIWIAMITGISMTDGAGVIPEFSSWLVPTLVLTAIVPILLEKRRLFRKH
jgi:DMSO/TMAO reductase YedYZ molybdopterin-dependent catalytic subunit